MDMDMPKMLLIAENVSSDDDFEFDYKLYCPLSSITLLIDEDDIISKIMDVSGTENDCIISNNGNAIKISSLKCKSYAEFLIALDLYDLIHDPSSTENHLKQYTTNEVATLKKLTHENFMLKEKIKQLKKILK